MSDKYKCWNTDCWRFKPDCQTVRRGAMCDGGCNPVFDRDIKKHMPKPPSLEAQLTALQSKLSKAEAEAEELKELNSGLREERFNLNCSVIELTDGKRGADISQDKCEHIWLADPRKDKTQYCRKCFKWSGYSIDEAMQNKG